MLNNEFLKMVFTPRSKVLFYPSCGNVNIRPEIFDLDYDLFVFSDTALKNQEDNKIAKLDKHYRRTFDFNELYRHHHVLNEYKKRDFYKGFIYQIYQFNKPTGENINEYVPLHKTHDISIFTYNRKMCVLFYWDNNLTLAYLKEMQAEIHAFIGVDDGCDWGNDLSEQEERYDEWDYNYECVNSEYWLTQIAQMAPAQGFLHITDHFPEGREIKYDEYGLKAEEIGYTKWAMDNNLRNNPFPVLMCNDKNLFIHQVQRISSRNIRRYL